jgi:hypothetical protein
MANPTPVDRTAAAALMRAGMSITETAIQLKCSTRTVDRIRRELGIRSRPPCRPFTADELATIERWIADGASVADALRTVGRDPHASYSSRFRGRGWSRRQVGEYATALRLARKAGVDL